MRTRSAVRRSRRAPAYDRVVPSLWSYRSRNSVLSVCSDGSVLSIGSVGSAASLGSVGSFASLGSVGSSMSRFSLLSHQSDGSVLSHQANRSIRSAQSHLARAGYRTDGDLPRGLAPGIALAALATAGAAYAVLRRR